MHEKLRAYRDREFDLKELVEASQALLRRAPSAPSDRRVAEYPDARTIRYYQTTGIVDPPGRYEGRRAIYGYTHLLQVVAVKLLQAEGHTLAQIQRALTQATERNLESAVLDGIAPLQEGGAKQKARTPAPPFGQGFAEQGHLNLELIPHRGAEQVGGPGESSAPLPLRSLTAVEIAPGITVIIDPEIVDAPESIITRIQSILDAEEGDRS